MLHTPNIMAISAGHSSTTNWISRTETRRFFDPNSKNGHLIKPPLRQRLKKLFEAAGEPRRIIFDNVPALSFDQKAPYTHQAYHILLVFEGRFLDFTVRDKRPGIVTVLKIDVMTTRSWSTRYTA